MGETRRLDVFCETSSDCDTASTCLDLAGTGRRQCAQICSVGGCDSLCMGGSVCFEVVGEDGELIPVDLDDDGFLEPLGACGFEVSRPPSPVWGSCGAGVGCEPGSGCVSVDGVSGTCLPLCTTACETLSGFLLECTPAGNASICVIWCDPAEGNLACPAGFRCGTLPDGGALCLLP